MKARTVNGGAAQEAVRPAPAANAKAAAECPDANECDLGIFTWRARGTSAVTRSGRRRRANGLTTPFMTAEVTAIDASPLNAALRPRGPPASARPAASDIEIFE